jgi:RNA polymerase sigma factor (sigma-70 family)
MAASQLGAALRHIRSMAADPKISEQTDGALLGAFLSRNDQAAFEALLRRHGPMVFRVCRRYLGSEHDAEDALQATFLVLARQAASVRKKESLASWLHGAAYRMAKNARRAAARRRGHEARVSPTQPQDPALSAAWQELQVLLDEEIGRLPGTLREPFVLCCVEHQSCALAARQLGVEEGAVWNRLGRARKLLQQRLTRRGILLPAGFVVALLGQQLAPAALPAALVVATAEAAAQLATGQTATGLISTKVAALTRGALKTMFATKLKAAAFILLAIAGAGILSYRTLAAGEGPPASAPAASQAAAADQPKEDLPAPAADEKETAFAGRVVDAAEKLVAGADVALLGEPQSDVPNNSLLKKVLAHGRSDGEGRFRLPVARAALADYRAAYVFAGKAGHGPAWTRAELKTPSQETLVRLALEKTVRGRLLDVQGQPAVGVRVSLTLLSDKPARKGGGAIVYVFPLEGIPTWPSPATTDKDGKFVMAGLSSDLDGGLDIDGKEFTPAHAQIGADRNEVNLTLAPARILEGVVKAADTGKPVPKAQVVCMDSGLRATCETDEKGGYRLRVPPGDAHEALPSGLSATPPPGQPYLVGQAPLEWPRGAVKHRIDLALPRGALIRGTVTDAATGKPIAGAVVNQSIPEAPYGGQSATTADDGTFTVVVPPVRGRLLVKGPNNDYVATEITLGELMGGVRYAYRSYPDAIIPFEAKAGEGALEVTAKLHRGVAIRGKLLGPGDKPVEDALMSCWNQQHRGGMQWGVLSFASVPVRDGAFVMRGCDPEATYPVYFLDAKNKLGATVKLSAKELAGKEATVRLEPCGSAVIRFLDKEGKPMKGFRPAIFIAVRPANNQPGDKDVYPDFDFLANVDTVNYRPVGLTADAEGRITYPVLIPGATYILATSTLQTKFKELTVKAGEELKMDIMIEPPQ